MWYQAHIKNYIKIVFLQWVWNSLSLIYNLDILNVYDITTGCNWLFK